MFRSRDKVQTPGYCSSYLFSTFEHKCVNVQNFDPLIQLEQTTEKSVCVSVGADVTQQHKVKDVTHLLWTSWRNTFHSQIFESKSEQVRYSELYFHTSSDTVDRNDLHRETFNVTAVKRFNRYLYFYSSSFEYLYFYWSKECLDFYLLSPWRCSRCEKVKVQFHSGTSLNVVLLLKLLNKAQSSHDVGSQSKHVNDLNLDWICESGLRPVFNSRSLIHLLVI